MKSLFTKALLLMLSLCLMSFMTVAQGTIKGKIVDSQTKEPLVGGDSDAGGYFGRRSCRSGW